MSDSISLHNLNTSLGSLACSENNYDVPVIQIPFLSPLPSGKSVSSEFDNVSSSIGAFPKFVTLFFHVESISVPTASVPKMNVLFQSNHPMQTRSKFGVFRPKILVASLHQELATVPISSANPRWKNAMEVEYQALLRNNTWKLFPPNDASHVIHSKWVFRTKLKADGTLDKYKARLVTKGFQQTPSLNFFETFSQVIKASTIRIIFTLVVSRGWDIQQIDVNNAFLNGDLHEDVFMTQPEGFVDPTKPNHV